MSKILILGATGSLGSHVVQQAILAGHEVSTLVRTPSKLPPDVQEKVVVYQANLTEAPISNLTAMFRGQDAVINAAGYVAEGQVFVNMVDRIVSALESLPGEDQPVCWFMAGAALLDIDKRGRRGVDLPLVRTTYWPHRANYDRICQTTLDWRLLCPGPMVDEPPLGLARLRLSIDRLPVQIPSSVELLPDALVIPIFSSHVPEMIVSYADAAALMLDNLTPNGEMSRHRVGLALPVGMRGKKKQWTAKPKEA